MTKPFKTLDEQIAILQSRGMIVPDINKAKDYLLKYNYYNVVNCYSKFLISSPDQYYIGATFDEIRSIHTFDVEIKSILLKNILIVEGYFKSIVSHYFCKQYQNIPYAYLFQTTYNSGKIRDIVSLISDLNSLINHERSIGNNSISHYSNNHNDVPLWVLSNSMTFGQIIRLYDCLPLKNQHEIVKAFNTIINHNMKTSSIRLTPNQLSVFMDNIKNTRNILAHGNKLFDFKCRNSYPYIHELHSQFGVDRTTNRQDVYQTEIALKLFLNESQYSIMFNSIKKRKKNLKKALQSIILDTVTAAYGIGF